MLKNKTIIIDLDGTLLNSRKEIEKTELKILERLSKNNHIILASGRSYIEIIRLIENYNLKQNIEKFIICRNGQQIYDVDEKCIIKSCVLDANKTINIIKKLDENEIYWYIIENNKLFCKEIKYNCEKYVENGRYKINIIKDLEELKNKNIEKFIINSDNYSKMEQIKKKLVRRYSIDFFKENSLKESKGRKYTQNNIIPKGVNKYTATQYIIKKLNLPKYIIAFGDGINDYELLKNADYSISMENGRKELKEISSFVTKSNDENGVSYAIEKIEEV